MLYFNYCSAHFELQMMTIVVDMFVNTVHFKGHLSESLLILIFETISEPGGMMIFLCCSQCLQSGLVSSLHPCA